MNNNVVIKISNLRKIQDEFEALKRKIEVNDVNTIKENWNDRNAQMFIDSLNDVVELLDKFNTKIDTSISTLSFHTKNEGITNE